MTTYHNPGLADALAAKAHVQAGQGAFAKANATYAGHLGRGSEALGGLLATMYVSIETLLASTTADVQALILSQHQVRPAKAGTSVFTPWIKVFAGQPRAGAKAVKDLKGSAQPAWEPNRSFEKYHHVMECLREDDVTEKHAEYIRECGGAVAMVEERQKRLRAAADPGKKAIEEEQRQLLLEEGLAAPFQLPFDLPDDAGEFFTVVCQQCEGGNPVMLGVVRANAEKDVTVLAAAQFEALKTAKAERENEERLAALVEQARQEERERKVGGMSAEERQELYRSVLLKHAGQKPAADQQAHG